MTQRADRGPLPAAVELGRRGGKARIARLSKDEIRELGSRGGRARARNLSKQKLREIARKAVQARWARERARKQSKKP